MNFVWINQGICTPGCVRIRKPKASRVVLPWHSEVEILQYAAIHVHFRVLVSSLFSQVRENKKV